MWRKAMPESDGLAGFDGLTASECIPTLRSGIQKMEDNPKDFTPMNPENGWGSFEGQLDFLRNVLNLFLSAPKATVVVSR